jgi:hypothetical protein
MTYFGISKSAPARNKSANQMTRNMSEVIYRILQGIASTREGDVVLSSSSLHTVDKVPPSFPPACLTRT